MNPTLRLSTPGDIVEAVPHLCGFVPTESLVAISLRGERRRIGLTLRIDLPEVEAAEEVAARLAHDAAAAAVLVVYTADGMPRPRSDLVDAVTAALERRGVIVLESLLVRAGRWWSYTCSSPACCPVDGTLLGNAPGLLAAMSAYDGRAVLRDRDELVASLAPPWPCDVGRLDAAVLAWIADLDEKGLVRARADAVAGIRAALVDEPSPALAASLVASLQDVVVRDEVATLALDSGEQLLTLLLMLARGSIAPYDVPVCTLIALVAWVRGDGALVNVALDRALTGDPTCSMALLLRAGLDGQLPPDAVREWLRETREALRRVA